MKRRSPTLAGFEIVFSRPSFGLAEIAWRWSFGFATALLLTFSVVEYLDTLPVTSRDEFLFRTRQPALISRALLHILQGSSLRLLGAAILLAIAMSLAWIVLGSVGRTATVRALLHHFRQSGGPQLLSSAPSPIAKPAGHALGSLIGLNFFRLAATLAAGVGLLGALQLGSATSSADHPAPASALSIIFVVGTLVVLAWAMLNWLLSLAAVVAVADACDTFNAIAGAVQLCRLRPGAIVATNTWFGLAHFVAFSIGSSAAAFPLAFVAVLPAGVVFGGFLAVTLLYFAVVDFLYVGRLAAYVVILNDAVDIPALESSAAPSNGGRDSRLTNGVDRDEPILSDLPSLVPES